MVGYDNIFSGRLVQNEIYMASREKSNFHLRPQTGTLTLSCVGTVGHAHQVKSQEGYRLWRFTGLRVPSPVPSFNFPSFLYFSFSYLKPELHHISNVILVGSMHLFFLLLLLVSRLIFLLFFSGKKMMASAAFNTIIHLWHLRLPIRLPIL